MILVAILIVAAALLCIALWNALAWPRIDGRQGEAARSISVLVPARDEEATLAACLETVLAQGRCVAEVLVYDDHSTDATPDVIAAFARRDGRIRSVPPAALPAGWCGKNFACQRLADEATGEWLLFLDADARLMPGAVERIVREAGSRDVTLLSCWPELELRSFWEKTLIPILNFVVFTLYPAPLSLVRSDVSLGLAHGACLLARRSTYRTVGGHEAVRDQIMEDVRLARAWRAAGERALCLDGRGIVRVRMYRTFGEIWRGFQKNFYAGFRRESSFWMFLLLHVAVFLAPVLVAPFAVTGRIEPTLLAAAACALAARVTLAIRFGNPLWPILLHPLSETLLIALGLSSWWRFRSGRGVEWKGRRYRASLTGEGE